MDEIIYGIFKVQYDFALEVWFSIGWKKGLKTVYSNTPKQEFLQTVKTQMKCSIMLLFISVYSVKVKKVSKQKNTFFFFNF